MLSPEKIETAVQLLLPALRDQSRPRKMLELLEQSPTIKTWLDQMVEEVMTNSDLDSETEEKVKAVFAIGLMIGEEAAHVNIS